MSGGPQGLSEHGDVDIATGNPAGRPDHAGQSEYIDWYDNAGNPVGQVQSTPGHRFTSILAGPNGIMYLGQGVGPGTGIYRFDSFFDVFLDGGAAWASSASLGLVADMELTPDGLYIMATTSGGNGNAGARTIDLATGTVLSNNWAPMSLQGRDGAIAFTPEPASLALLGLGGLMMVRRRR